MIKTEQVGFVKLPVELSQLPLSEWVVHCAAKKQGLFGESNLAVGTGNKSNLSALFSDKVTLKVEGIDIKIFIKAFPSYFNKTATNKLEIINKITPMAPFNEYYK